MDPLLIYRNSNTTAASEASRIGRLLGLQGSTSVIDVDLADRISCRLDPRAADAIVEILGRDAVISQSALGRARKSGSRLSREASARIYNVARVLDAVSRVYRGDRERIVGFMNLSHAMLSGRTPVELAVSSSAGATAVVNLLGRGSNSFAC